MENGHRNSGFSHEKWWIFPLQIVSSPEGNMDDDWGYPYDFGNLRNIPWPHPAPSTAPDALPRSAAANYGERAARLGALDANMAVAVAV